MTPEAKFSWLMAAMAIVRKGWPQRSLRGIADELNRHGIPIAAGTGEWRAMQVSRVLARLPGDQRHGRS